MPTYEYACRSCEERLEVVQSFHDDPLTECPACGTGELRKVFSPVGISFKGSGFYKTDSRSTSSAATTASGGDSSSDSSSSTSADSKPAAAAAKSSSSGD